MATKEKRRRPRPAPEQETRRRKPVRRERKLRDSDVVYTPPKPFRRGRFFLRLATVAAIVLAMVFGMSIFFKVKTVRVSGCEKYTAWEVSQASGIEEGTNLMAISRAQVSGSIISNLPYVDKVRVGINLPDTVMIEITELDAVYTVEDIQGNWWMMNDTGRIIEQTNGVTAKDYTQVLGVKIQVPAVGQQALAEVEALTEIPLEAPQDGEQTETEPTEAVVTRPAISVGITGAERLQTALTILQELGTSSISGMIDSVNVTSLTSIELWYDERFQVNLGDTGQLTYKISALQATINKMESYESGHLDLSFTNWPDKVGYTPFT